MRVSNHVERGATLVEFALVLTLGVLPLVLGILQVAALLVAKNELNLAAYMAARQGAVSGADPDAMRRELARSMVAMYVRVARAGAVPAADVAVAYAAAMADVTALDTLAVLSPTRAVLDRVGINRGGRRVIPNDSIEFRAAAVQAANVLTIEVTHCQPLVVPLAGPALALALAVLDADPRHRRCVAFGRAPIAARASLVMQSDVHADALR
ncbi:MAG: pilus assembly protein [Gammaproteobacteria bacterium]|nr:pilus assembly protein [Gammaproteobacteria bacterium]